MVIDIFIKFSLKRVRDTLKRVCKTNFKLSMTDREDLVFMEMNVTSLELNRPIYVGFTILELSKLHMYGFH